MKKQSEIQMTRKKDEETNEHDIPFITANNEKNYKKIKKKKFLKIKKK